MKTMTNNIPRTNALLANYKWVLEESRLRALTRMSFSVMDPDDDDADDDTDPGYQVVGGVAVISIVGNLVKYDEWWTEMMGGISTLTLQNKLQAALDDPNVNATLLIIDSGGGMMNGTVDLASVVAGSDKPVWAYVSDTCCSGAYWIASQCDEIWANDAAQIGSIGVYMAVADTSQMYKKAGVELTIIKAGDLKGIGVDGTPLTDEQASELQREVDDSYDLFVSRVASGRGDRLKDAKAVATGQAWIASKALDMGLIDGIATLNDVAGKLQQETSTMADNKDFGVKPVTTQTAVTEPVTTISITQAGLDARLASARTEGAAAEVARLNGLVEVAGDRPAFALEQFKIGHSRTQAIEVLNSVLKAELAASKNALVDPPAGVQPVATGVTGVQQAASGSAGDPIDVSYDSLTPDEKAQVGTKEQFEAYKKACKKFKIK